MTRKPSDEAGAPESEAVEAAKRYLNAKAEFERIGNLLSTDETEAAYKAAKEELSAATAHLPEIVPALLSLFSRVETAREEMREECAKVADAWCKKNHWPNGAWGIAANIRSLSSLSSLSVK